MPPSFHYASPGYIFWSFVTRLGEAQILLPAFVALAAWLVLRARAPGLAARWMLSVAAAAVVTTLTKVAFIGWGVGFAPWDYTGISGHAMFAAAVLPLLLHAGAGSPQRALPWLALGYALAALIAMSRVATGAHSASEALLGFGLGSAASAWALRVRARPDRLAPKAWLAALALWLVVMPAGAPPSRTHDYVTQLSLALSGRSVPYTRAQLHAPRLPAGRWAAPPPTL